MSVGEITELIGRERAGDVLAAERLFAIIYDELRHPAAAQLRGDDAVRPASLVHEAYLTPADRGAWLAEARQRIRSARTSRSI